MNKAHQCPLCGSSLVFFNHARKRDYLRCMGCDSIVMDTKHHLSLDDEKARYLEHNNDVEDLGYQGFVAPIVETVFEHYNIDHKGLDFGAGTGPVIAKLLKDKDYQIEFYDPFFAKDERLLQQSYDYVIACEVVEHFYKPNQEFKLLKSLLKEGGKLILMTVLYDDSIQFSSWHYKNDQTHVFFYTKKALDYIQRTFGFSKLSINGRLIIFSN